MKRCSIPSIFPNEGVYEASSIHVHLSSATNNSRIHYTLDGSEPDLQSPIYNRDDGLLLISDSTDSHEIILKAFSEADGCIPSRVETFTYRFLCRRKGTYRHTMLREGSDKAPVIIRIEDFDLDKMYLVIGTEKAVLIDAGLDAEGDLLQLCKDLVGEDIPLELIIAHGHPDHVAHMGKYIEAGIVTYFPFEDKETAYAFIDVNLLDSDHVHAIKEGDTWDLGNAKLQAYQLPGHTPGGIVLVDEKNGDVFASDELGSNRRYVPDTAWLQLAGISVETCLRNIQSFREKTKGRLKRIFTGHNDEPLPADLYLDILEQALDKAVKGGNDSLEASFRNARETFGSGTICVEGDWRYDPVWAGANVRFIYDRDCQAETPVYARGYDPKFQL